MNLTEERLTEELTEEFLAQASELVQSGWCQGASARDQIGNPIDPSSVFARRWSLAGALERAWRRSTVDRNLALRAFVAANLALAAAIGDTAQHWNDEEVRTLDHALEALLDARQLVETTPEHRLTS